MKSAPFSVCPILLSIYLSSFIYGGILGGILQFFQIKAFLGVFICAFITIISMSKIRYFMAKMFHNLYNIKGNVPYAFSLVIRILIALTISILIATFYTFILTPPIGFLSGSVIGLISSVIMSLIMSIKMITKGPTVSK